MEPYLTERESHVLSLLAFGLTNKEISNKLHISVHTTKAHLESIYDKLDVSNRVQAVVRAVQLDAVSVDEILPNKVVNL